MAVLDVLRFPDERLRTVAEPITEVNEEIKTLIEDMFETMNDESGVGLAATQVNRHVRMFVLDVSENSDDPHVFINPEIINKEGSMINEEGCLSVPHSYAKVERAEKVTMKALDKNGNEFTKEAEGSIILILVSILFLKML